MLYLVSTPIGNLEDITLRAIRILKEVDLILVEDTRRTAKLLKHYKIINQQQVYNDFSKQRLIPKVLHLLSIGKSIALVTDSGTPLISDPGYLLCKQCILNNFKIIPVPGPSAAISALVCSGLEVNNFCFYGFFPKQNSKIHQTIDRIANASSTMIFYESPNRIIKTLEAISARLPARRVVIARELTKKFEEFIRGSATEVYHAIKSRKLKGEITLIISGEKQD